MQPEVINKTAADGPFVKTPRTRARKVAEQFEAIFVTEMVRGLRKTTGIGKAASLFGSGPGADTYSQWFDHMMADRLTNHGGVGLADVMMKDWERYGQIPAKEQHVRDS